MGTFCRSIFVFAFVSLINFHFAIAANDATDSCECPELTCENPCEQQDGITFYSEKCEGGKKVKSCAKPTCVASAKKSSACLAFEKTQPQRNIASEAEKNKDKIEKYVATTKKEKIGSVRVVFGKAWLRSAKGIKKKVKLGMAVREFDTIITDAHSRVKMEFYNGNIVNVMPSSELKLTKYHEDSKTKKTVIDLIKGKVRSRVKQKYKGANFYRVRTKGAVAGVRGTDFVVSYTQNQKSITKVQTLRGEVKLASGDQAQAQHVKAGQESSYVIAANSADVFDDNEISEFVARGYMTPVYQMTAQELKVLEQETKVHQHFNKAIARSKNNSRSICSEPSGQMNQCAWMCKNNPQGEKRCRTDLPQVNCVRKRCNANGDWADDTRLPASYFDMCKPDEIVVAPCDY